MKFVQLTMVTGRQSAQIEDNNGEDDGIAAIGSVETTSAVAVDVSKLRAFYPRKPQRDGSPRIGTRLTFDNGAGMAVTETFEEVLLKVS